MPIPRLFGFGTNADGTRPTSTTTVQASSWTFKEGTYTTFQAWVTGGGSATVAIEASNDPNTYSKGTATNVVSLGTITLSSGTPSGSLVVTAPYRAVRANVTAVTGGAVSVSFDSSTI